MTRKDFDLIAGVLNNYNIYTVCNQTEIVQVISDDLAREFIQINPNFNTKKWAEATGTKEVKL